MADLVGVFAASHTPVMLNFPMAITEADREQIYGSFKTLGARLKETRPDAVIVIADDHLHNFFLNNFPAFCVGVADHYETPAEHWLKADKQRLKGDAQLGGHLLGEALNAGFDPSFSMELTLDHGVLTPLVLGGIASEVPIVPLLINCVQPPFPSMQRCLNWGKFMRQAIASCGHLQRIAVLATGGLSHDVATPRMGLVNEAFDRQFLELLSGSRDSELIEYSTKEVGNAGNGTEEVRNWLVAHGAAGGARFEPLYYKALPQWYAGIALGSWRL